MLTASRPEAQKRLSWTPATVSGRPALIAAVLAMSAPWSPTGETQPRTTSSTLLGSSRSLRTSISCIRPTTRSTGLVACRDPLTLPLPRGVRIASNTNASVAAIASYSSVEVGRGTLPQKHSFVNASSMVVTWPSRIDAEPHPAQPGRAQRRHPRGAARRDDRLPGRGRLRQHDDRARRRARRRLPRRPPAPLPDSRRARRRGGRAAAQRRDEELLAAADALPAGPERIAAGPRPALGELRQPALPGGARSLDQRAAPTPSCAAT